MEPKINFVERFVFSYDASRDGFGILQDIYEMFHLETEEALYKIFKMQDVKMTQEQYKDILKMMQENNNEIEIVVFYELNKIPVLAFYGEDYIELTDKIFESKENYISRNKYTEIETTPQMINWAKNNLKIKYLRYNICNFEKAED